MSLETTGKLRKVNTEESGITRRFTYQLSDGLTTRAARIERLNKTILCISSQVGCTGACKFCSAWQTPLVRNLLFHEMLSMIDLEGLLEKSCKPVLISFMGTGEPMANLDNVVQLIQHLRSMNLGIRIALSTSGYNLDSLTLIPHYVKLQFSIISPFQYLQKRYIPHAETLDRIAEAIRAWPGEKETNTTLIEGINNDKSSMRALASWISKIPVHAKLNYFHGVNSLIPADNEFMCLKWMRDLGADVELYRTDGEEINAACGQFELN